RSAPGSTPGRFVEGALEAKAGRNADTRMQHGVTGETGPNGKKVVLVNKATETSRPVEQQPPQVEVDNERHIEGALRAARPNRGKPEKLAAHAPLPQCTRSGSVGRASSAQPPDPPPGVEPPPNTVKLAQPAVRAQTRIVIAALRHRPTRATAVDRGVAPRRPSAQQGVAATEH
ncbi:MAG: hypothetical protein ACK55W_02695, partial [Pseudomonadota bacterium]